MKKPYANATDPCCACGGTRWSFLFEKGGFDFVRCNACGLEKTAPLPTGDQIAAYYRSDGEDASYAARVNFARRDTVHRTIFEWAIAANGKVPARVLDVGCLNGALLDHFRDAGAETHGIELQAEAAAIASAGHGGRVHNGTIESYVAEGGSGDFDMVAIIGVIEHVTDPRSVMEAIRGLIRPGGLLIMQTPSTGSALRALLGRNWPPYVAIEHIHYFGPRSLGHLLAGTGFAIEEVKDHWKVLELGFFHQQCRIFIPWLYRIVDPLWRLLPGAVGRIKLPMYVGEILVRARAL